MQPHDRIDALTYRSDATDALTPEALEHILLRSRALNAGRGITGVLVTRGPAIVQYIEGPPVSLARTFPAIAASPLHRDIRVLARAERVARRFDRWHMGFARFEPMRPGDEAGEWTAILAMLRADPAGNDAFMALLAGTPSLAPRRPRTDWPSRRRPRRSRALSDTRACASGGR